VADYTFDFSAQTTANPWTVPSPLTKLSTTNFAITNASGARSASNGSAAWLAHNVSYTGGATQIKADITVPSWVLNGDLCGPGIFVRSGANAKNGYRLRVDGAGAMYLDKVSGGNFTETQLNSVGSITLVGTDTLSIGYVPNTGVITGYQNGVSKLTATDSTYAAEASLAPGIYSEPGNTNSQYVKTFAGTGVASGVSVAVLTANYYRRRRLAA
jgi:hypothetical protein